MEEMMMTVYKTAWPPKFLPAVGQRYPPYHRRIQGWRRPKFRCCIRVERHQDRTSWRCESHTRDVQTHPGPGRRYPSNGRHSARGVESRPTHGGGFRWDGRDIRASGPIALSGLFEVRLKGAVVGFADAPLTEVLRLVVSGQCRKVKGPFIIDNQCTIVDEQWIEEGGEAWRR